MKLSGYVMSLYKRYKCIKRMDENGLTLVEVLASVVLLTIIITIFLNVFIQSAKTNTTSEEVVDATYLAQTEMEQIYIKSTETKYSERENAFGNLGYRSLSSEDEWLIFEKELDEDYVAKIKLQNHSMEVAENMNRLIVTVHDKSAPSKTQAQMESILVWEADVE